jgi:hypothetical protein
MKLRNCKLKMSASSSPSPKDYCQQFFTRVQDDETFLSCNFCGVKYKCLSGAGYINAFNHLKGGAHPGYE